MELSITKCLFVPQCHHLELHVLCCIDLCSQVLVGFALYFDILDTAQVIFLRIIY